MDTTSSEKPTGNTDAEVKLKVGGGDKPAEKKDGSPGGKSATELEPKASGGDKDEPSNAKQEQESGGGEDGHQNPRAAEMEPKAIDETKLTAADNEEGSPGGKSATELELKAIDETKLTTADNEEGSPDEKSAAEVEPKGIDKDEPSDPEKEQESSGREDGHEDPRATALELKASDKEQESAGGEDGHEEPRAAELKPKVSDQTKLTAADNEEASPGEKSAAEVESKAIDKGQGSIGEEDGHEDPRAAELEPKAIDETKLPAADNEEGSPDEKSAAEAESKTIDKGQGSSGEEDGHEDPRAAKLEPKAIDEARPTEKEHKEEEKGGSKSSASLNDDGDLSSKILAGVASIDLGREDDEAAGPIDQHREGSYDVAGEGHDGKSGTPPDGDSGDSSQQPPQRSKKSDKFTSVDSSALGFTAQRTQYQPMGRQTLQVFTNRGGQDGRGGGSAYRFPARPYGGYRPTEDQRMRNVSNRSPSFQQQRRPMTPGSFSSGGGGGGGPYPRQGFDNRTGGRGGGPPSRFPNRPSFDCPNQRPPQNVYASQRDQGDGQQNVYTNQGGPGGAPQMGYRDQGGPGGGPQVGYRDQGGPGGAPQMGYRDQGGPGGGPQMGYRDQGGPAGGPQMGYKQGYNTQYPQQGVRSGGGSFQSPIPGQRRCITAQSQMGRPPFDASSRGPPPHIPTMPSFTAAPFMIQPPGGGQPVPYVMVPASQMPYGMAAPFYPNMMPAPYGGVMPMGGVGGQPQPGTKCEVLASDQNYYPATIIQPRSEDPNTLTVRFDSTGYETDVNMQALRFNQSGEN